MRHPHLGPRAVAGQRRQARRRLDRQDDAQGRRPLRTGVRRGAADARRGRLADERRRLHRARHGRLRLCVRRPLRVKENGALANPADGPHRLSVAGKALKCIQMPTTLPTLDEVLGCEIDGSTITTSNIAAFLLRLTEGATRDHVYTLHAELEGQKLAPIFEQLLAGWQAQGYQLASMADYHQKIKDLPMPVCPITWGELPGRS